MALSPPAPLPTLATLAARAFMLSLHEYDPGSVIETFSLLPPAIAVAVLPEFAPERIDSHSRAAVVTLVGMCEAADLRDNRALIRAFVDAASTGPPALFPGLRALRCRNSELTPRDAAFVARSAPCLDEIAVTDSAEVPEASLLALIEALRDTLRSVDFSWTAAVSSATLSAALACPCLESLSLAGCTAVTSGGDWPTAPPTLTRLDLSHCKFMDRDALSHVLVAGGLLFRAHSLALVETDVTGRTLDEAAAAAAAMHGLPRPPPGVPLPLTELRSLAVSWCDGLEGSDVARLASASPRLEFLRAKCISSLDDSALLALAAACPRLRELNLDRCGEITDAGVAALVAGCPVIEEASLSWSLLGDAGLAAAVRGWGGLRRLSVAGCKTLTAAGVVGAVREAAGGTAAAGGWLPLQTRLDFLDLAWVNAVSPAVVAELAALLPITTLVDYYGEAH